jgi:ribose 5-phosphate isomerase B
MKIAIASDHAGFSFKNELKAYLEKKNCSVNDFGCFNDDSCDYPDFGIQAARSVANSENDYGILVCGNGIGMSMLANKIPGILAAVVYSKTSAEATRKHHDSNILCLGAREFKSDQLLRFVDIWFENKFEGERHVERIKKVKDLDKR